MSTEGIPIPGIALGGSQSPAADRTDRATSTRWRGLLRRPTVRVAAVDTIAIVFAALDVWLVFPEKAQTYSIVLSGIACAALLIRRWLPFGALLLIVPGYLAGWAQLAAMIALGMLAAKLQLHWKVIVGAVLVWACRFVLWPLPDFAALSWREHVLDGIYGVLVAGMPVALGLLYAARTELRQRLSELAKARDREDRLHTRTVRADERARLAREMHDVVSHDVTLIAMQAAALTATCPGDEEAQRSAKVIRELSTRTLEQLRELVGVLRSDVGNEPNPGLGEVDQLLRSCTVPVRLSVDNLPSTLPDRVSSAAYRTVQECLTNVHKHAPGTSATVRLTGEPGALRVEVSNGRPTGRCESLPSGGNGLAGLAERAALLGGSVESGVTNDGGFRVTARYPLPERS